MSTHFAESDDRRTDHRRRVVKAAKIAFGDFVFVRDATLRDVAPNGARIRVAGIDQLPDEFYVVLVAEKTMRKAHVVWRSDDEVGVVFAGEARDLVTDPDPRLRQFRFG
jgi:two-component system cell cycle response regulator